MIIGKFPKLLNVTYIRPNKKSSPEVEESFEVIYVDDNGLVRKSNEPALAEIWFVKPELRTFNYNKPQEKMENMFSKQVQISQIKYEIAKEIGPEGDSFIKNCFNTRDYKSLDKLFGWRYAFGCDFQPEFYYMKEWYNKYPLQDVKLSKAFIDIETDLMDYLPDLDNLAGSAYAPVNCATVILDSTKEVFTFILNPYKPSRLTYPTESAYNDRMALYSKQLEQHNKLLENLSLFTNELNESFDSTYGSLKYQIRNYEKEIDLIADIFRLLNDRKPNFCLAWNMRFDIQYLYERIKAVGYDPKSIMCNPDFDIQRCFFKLDKIAYQISRQQDYFYCSSYTQYICQMRLYSNIRKSQHTLKSVSLNAISDLELKDKKIDYPEETNIVYFPYIDWKLFITYNIKDTLLQYGIENKVRDVDTYYNKSHANLTPYNKIFRETHLLRNVREQSFNAQGWVQSNNVNNIESDDDDLFLSIDDEVVEDPSGGKTFKGAIMADPKMNAKNGMPILGVPSNIVYSNTIDADMAAFYPSNKIASNMDPDTMLFKASLNNQEFISGEFANNSLNIEYSEKDKNGKNRELDISGQVVHTFVSGNILTFGYNHLNFPTIAELDREVRKAITKEKGN